MFEKSRAITCQDDLIVNRKGYLQHVKVLVLLQLQNFIKNTFEVSQFYNTIVIT